MKTEEQIKVLLVLPFFYPHRGGSQKYAEEIFASMMKKHPNVRVDVLCYNTDNAPTFEEYRGFRIYRIGCWHVISARFALPNPVSLFMKLISLSKNNYDFVNTHIRFFDPTWWLWAYAKVIKAKSIFTGHVAVHPVHQNKIVELTSKLVDLTISRFSLKFYDLITFTNKTARDFFKEKLWVKKNSRIVYGGIDTRYFKPSEKKEGRLIPKANVKIDENEVVITYVGRLIWTKGITYLYDAALDVLKRSDKKIKFVIAGPGELEKKIKNQTKLDNLEDKVILTGDLTYEEVKELLSQSDIFVNPSHHNEGFPNNVLEAGASGCYVIATDNAGTWEVVRNGQTGQLTPQKDSKALSDAIVWALENPEERKKIAKKFRKELEERFDWDIISEQLYSLLTKQK